MARWRNLENTSRWKVEMLFPTAGLKVTRYISSALFILFTARPREGGRACFTTL